MDSHVHTEWSWDAADGSMERSCARAVELGLPAIAFTEHVDHTVWPVTSAMVEENGVGPRWPGPTGCSGHRRSRRWDTWSPSSAVETGFATSGFLTGLELGEPHWHAEAVARVLRAGRLDRVLGSLHCLPDGAGFAEPPGLVEHRDPDEVLRTYLAEVARLVTETDTFSVLAHIAYPVRQWPDRADGAPYSDAIATFHARGHPAAV